MYVREVELFSARILDFDEEGIPGLTMQTDLTKKVDWVGARMG